MKKILLILGILVVAGIIGATAYTLRVNNPPVPKFSTSLASDSGWWTGHNTNVQAMAKSIGSDYKGEEPIDKLPVADITIHHGEEGSKNAPADNCFTSFSYYNQPLNDLAAAYKNYEDRKNQQSHAEKLEPVKKTITTFEGNKDYELQRYNYVIEGQNILSGYQVGFIPMSGGYIRTEGVCKTPADLDLLTPIIATVQLNEH